MGYSRSLLLCVAVAVAVGVGGCGSDSDSAGGGPAKASELNVLTWEGYTEPEWVKPFEDETGAKVNITYIGSDDELLAKMKGGRGETYDVVATNRANLEPLADQELLSPIDDSRIAALDEVAESFRDASLLKMGGQRFGIPFIWGGMSLSYNEDDFDSPPESWSVVFEPPEELCGKIIWSEDAGVMTSTAALYLGFEDPYQLSDSQLAEVKQLLERGRECTTAFYSGLGDAANYYISGDADAGLSSGSLIVKLAKDGGAPVVETVPKEGALGWLDTWAITRGGADKADLVYRWLDHMISPEVQLGVASSTSFGPTVSGVGDQLDPELRDALRLDDPEYFERFVPMRNPQPPDSWEKRLNLWNAVKAGA